MLTYRKLVLGIIFFVFLLNCSTGQQATPKVKNVFHCKVVVDKSFYEGTSSWQDNIRTIMNRLSYDFDNWFTIGITVDTIIAFDMDRYGCTDKSGMECLYENIPRGAEDFVVHFFRGGGYSIFETIGATRPDIGYVAVKQMENVNIDMRFQYLYTTLLHEMCHLFGGVHVYGKEKSNYLMEPVINDNVTKVGKELVMKEAEVDRGNFNIMLGMSNRPFSRSKWNRSLWTKIERLYNKQIDVNNTSRINEDGRLVDFYDDHFIPTDTYRMLVTWAGLCGDDSAAFCYIDKSINYLKEFCVSCNTGSLGGRSKLMCLPFYGVNTGELVKLNKIYARYDRAIALLQSNKRNEADNQISMMLVEGKDYPLIKWKLVESQYYWERNNIWVSP